jgi:hypothetical protein
MKHGAPALLSPFSWSTTPNDLLSKRLAPFAQKKFKKRKRPIQSPYFVKALVGARPLIPKYTDHPLNLTTLTTDSKSNSNVLLQKQCQVCCDWSNIPPELDPGGSIGTDGQPLPAVLPLRRINNKRQQVSNVCAFAIPIISKGLRESITKYKVVDFCCGSGWQTLPLAFHFPNVQFILIDSKKRSLQVAKRRAIRAGLKNVRTLLMSIEDFEEDFHLGIALHACGPATDISMKLCVNKNADFIMIPCCIGKVQTKASYFTTNDSVVTTSSSNGSSSSSSSTVVVADEKGINNITYPRSELGRMYLSREEYDAIAKAADFGHKSDDDDDDVNDVVEDKTKQPIMNKADRWKDERRICKSIIENDRALSCSDEYGYTCTLSIMLPKTCSPKNDVIIGISQKKCTCFWDMLPNDLVYKIIQYVLGNVKGREINSTCCQMLDSQVKRLGITPALVRIYGHSPKNFSSSNPPWEYYEYSKEHLGNIPIVSIKTLKNRLLQCKNLRSLEIHFLSSIALNDSMIDWFAKALPNLVELRLYECDGVTDKRNTIHGSEIKKFSCWRSMVEPMQSINIVEYQVRALLDNSEEGIIACASKRSAANIHLTGSAEMFGQMIRNYYPIMMNGEKNVYSVRIFGMDADGRSSIYNDTYKELIYIEEERGIAIMRAKYYVCYYGPPVFNLDIPGKYDQLLRMYIWELVEEWKVPVNFDISLLPLSEFVNFDISLLPLSEFVESRTDSVRSCPKFTANKCIKKHSIKISVTSEAYARKLAIKQVNV